MSFRSTPPAHRGPQRVLPGRSGPYGRGGTRIPGGPGINRPGGSPPPFSQPPINRSPWPGVNPNRPPSRASPGAPGTIRLPGDPPPGWGIPRPKPKGPTTPRSPGVNPRRGGGWRRLWPLLPILPILPIIPSLPELITGTIPDLFEQWAPGFWEWIGWKPPREGENVYPYGAIFKGLIHDTGAIELLGAIMPGGKARIEIKNVQPTRPDLQDIRQFGYVTDVHVGGYRDDDNITIGLPTKRGTLYIDPNPKPTNDPRPVQEPYPSPQYPSLPLPGRYPGVQPTTRPTPGVPTRSPRTRPATDPRAGRPDLNPIPSPPTNPVPRPPQTPTPDDDPDRGGTNCRFDSNLVARIQALLLQVQALEFQNQELNRELAAANQSTAASIPYVVEFGGERMEQSLTISLKGIVDTSQLTSLLQQTADWAQQESGDKSQRVYDLLGGDQIWGSAPNPVTQFNPESLLQSAVAAIYPGAGQEAQSTTSGSLPEMLAKMLTVLFYRQGLHQFPALAPDPAVNRDQQFLAQLGVEVPAAQPINTANDLWRWQTEQLLEPLGAWHQQIQIPNPQDAAAPINQTIPDISSALMELLQINMQQAQTLTAIQNIGVRTGLEASAAHVESVVTKLNLMAVIEYLNFEFTEEPLDVAIAFDLPPTGEADNEPTI